MLKEYKVYYGYKTFDGDKVITYTIVKTLKEVTKTKSNIKKLGHSFIGVKWRERRIWPNKECGWKDF